MVSYSVLLIGMAWGFPRSLFPDPFSIPDSPSNRFYHSSWPNSSTTSKIGKSAIFQELTSLSRINCSSNFTSRDFFHFSFFMQSKQVKKIEISLGIFGNWEIWKKIHIDFSCKKLANLRTYRSFKFTEDPEE